MTNEQKLWELKFDLDRATRYHGMRASFFESWHKYSMLAILILGSASFLTIMGWIEPFLVKSGLNVKAVSAFGGAASALLGLLELVFTYSTKAARHREAEGNYEELFTRLHTLTVKDTHKINSLFEEYGGVRSNFEGRYRVINIICHNQVLEANKLASNVSKVSLWQYAMKNFLFFSGTKFQ